jgi:hypothetical protein
VGFEFLVIGLEGDSIFEGGERCGSEMRLAGKRGISREEK